MPKTRSIHRRSFLGAALGLSLAGGAARAQTASKLRYPTGPIRLTLPVAAGDVLDQLMRAVLPDLARQLDTRLELFNEPNAAKAALALTKAPVDGYSLLLGTQETQAIIPAVLTKPEYDPIADMATISGVASVTYALLARRGLVARDLRDLLDLAGRQPNRFRAGSTGRLGSCHVALSVLGRASNLTYTEVSFPTVAEVLAALVGETIDFAVLPLGPATTAARNGLVKVFAQMGRTRHTRWTSLATIGELGFEHAEFTGWSTIEAPAGVAADVVAVLAAAIGDTVQDRRARAAFDSLACTIDLRSAVSFNALAAAERAEFTDIARREGPV